MGMSLPIFLTYFTPSGWYRKCRVYPAVKVHGSSLYSICYAVNWVTKELPCRHQHH